MRTGKPKNQTKSNQIKLKRETKAQMPKRKQESKSKKEDSRELKGKFELRLSN
jgi:hypothetical protein